MPSQVNRVGTGLRVMGGLNSELVPGEAPDIVSERSPFGSYVVPPSPMAGPHGEPHQETGTKLGPQGGVLAA